MIRLFFFFLEKLNIEIWNFTRCSHRASFQWTAITEFAYFVGGRTCGKGKGKELAPSTQTVRETFYTAGRLWNGVHVTTIKRCGRHCFLTPIFNSPRSSCVYFVKKWEAGSFLFRQANKFDFQVNRIKLKLIKRWIKILKNSTNVNVKFSVEKKWHISPLRHRRRWSGEGVTWAAGGTWFNPFGGRHLRAAAKMKSERTCTLQGTAPSHSLPMCRCHLLKTRARYMSMFRYPLATGRIRFTCPRHLQLQ